MTKALAPLFALLVFILASAVDQKIVTMDIMRFYMNLPGLIILIASCAVMGFLMGRGKR